MFNWWAVLEQLAALAFQIKHLVDQHGGHGSFSSKLVVIDEASGQPIGELPGPTVTL